MKEVVSGWKAEEIIARQGSENACEHLKKISTTGQLKGQRFTVTDKSRVYCSHCKPIK